MVAPLHIADLDLIRQLFFPDNRFVYLLDQAQILPANQYPAWLLPWKAAPERAALHTGLLLLSGEAPASRRLDEFPVVLDWTGQILQEQQRGFRFDFLRNPDGTLRWIYPSGESRPFFLNLYNGSGPKAHLFRLGAQGLFRSRLSGLLRHGSFRLRVKGEYWLNSAIEGYPHFALFTGTTGHTRKAVLALGNHKGQVTDFLKIPLSEQAAGALDNERRRLDQLQTWPLRRLVVPKVGEAERGLLVSNVRPASGTLLQRPETLRLEALHEVYLHSASEQALNEIPAWSETDYLLERIPQEAGQSPQLVPETILRLHQGLLRLKDRIPEQQLILTALSHGDFTPWNMYAGAGRLHLYDWEMAQRLPVYYDLFHFVFQTGILVEHLDVSAIERKLEVLWEKAAARRLLSDFPTDLSLSYRFYLLHNSTYYLWRYSRQPFLHQQAHWLIAAWTEAVEKAG